MSYDIESINTPGIDTLRALNRKLAILLEKPEPGLYSWRTVLSRTLLDMADYAGYGEISKRIRDEHANR